MHALLPPTRPQVRKSIIGFDVEGLNTSSAWEAGFGSLYWMEGVVTRLADRHGGALAGVEGLRLNNELGRRNGTLGQNAFACISVGSPSLAPALPCLPAHVLLRQLTLCPHKQAMASC